MYSLLKYVLFDGENWMVNFEDFIGDENIRNEVWYFNYCIVLGFFSFLIIINVIEIIYDSKMKMFIFYYKLVWF